MKCTENEITYLIHNKENNDNEIARKLHRTKSSIIGMRNKLCLKRDSNVRRNSNLEILLNDNIISFYWIGFIMADGHISNRRRLKIELSIKDKLHLLTFCKYINTSNIKYNSNITNFGNHMSIKTEVRDIIHVKQICDKFDLHSNKTMNPPNFSNFNFTNEQIMAIINWFD